MHRAPANRKSGRLDLNQRPFGPQPNALPDCATPRGATILARLWAGPRAARAAQRLVGGEPGLRRPRDRPRGSHRPALHKWPTAAPWTKLATYPGGLALPTPEVRAAGSGTASVRESPRISGGSG